MNRWTTRWRRTSWRRSGRSRTTWTQRSACHVDSSKFLTKLFFNYLSPFCKSFTTTARSLSACLSLTLSPFPPNPLPTNIVPLCFSISLPLSLLQGSRVGTGVEANSHNVLIVGLGSQNVFQHARSGRQRPVGREWGTWKRNFPMNTNVCRFVGRLDGWCVICLKGKEVALHLS